MPKFTINNSTFFLKFDPNNLLIQIFHGHIQITFLIEPAGLAFRDRTVDDQTLKLA